MCISVMWRTVWLTTAIWAGCALSGVSLADDDPQEKPELRRYPAYQRHRMTGAPPADQSPFAMRHASPAVSRRHAPQQPFHQRRPFRTEVTSSSWFQRPYPYHLDYYRMRYGGTYEPYYSGGLYGTPQVLLPPGYGYGYGGSQPYGQPMPLPGYP